jgi:hypothetical protein
MLIRTLKTALFCVLLTTGISAQADEKAAPAPKPADAVPVSEPKPIVMVRTDIYGNVTSRAGKNLTIQALVSTNSDPIPVGSKGILFRRVPKADGQAGDEYVQIAKVSFKKLDALSSKVTMVIEEEMKDVLVNGKKSNHFAKSTKVKLQIDLPAPVQ